MRSKSIVRRSPAAPVEGDDGFVMLAVRVLPSQKEAVKRAGEGNMSRGFDRMVALWESKATRPKVA